MDLLAEGVEAEAEALGRVFLAAAINEDGAEGLVQALGVAGGLEEEKATKGVVHAHIPACEALSSEGSSGSIWWRQRSSHARSTRSGTAAREKRHSADAPLPRDGLNDPRAKRRTGLETTGNASHEATVHPRIPRLLHPPM